MWKGEIVRMKIVEGRQYFMSRDLLNTQQFGINEEMYQYEGTIITVDIQPAIDRVRIKEDGGEFIWHVDDLMECIPT